MILLALLLLVGTIEVIWIQHTSKYYRLEALQRAKRSIAAELAAMLEPYTSPTVDFLGLQRELFELQLLNPDLSIYVLSSAGEVLYYNGPSAAIGKNGWINIPGTMVPLAPLQRFLKEPRLQEAVYGYNPREPERAIPFTAAPFTFASERGYLYVVFSAPDGVSTADVVLLDYVRFNSIVAVLIGTAALTIIGLLLLQRLTRPVERMSSALQRIAAGDLKARIGLAGPDEIGSAARAIDTMAEQLQCDMEELKQIDNLQRGLVTGVANRLSKPLSSLAARANVLAGSGEEASENLAEAYEELYRQTRALGAEINRLFEYAKLEADREAFPLLPVELGAVLSDIAPEFSKRAEQQGIRFELQAASGLPAVEANRGLLIRILVELFDNAAAAAPGGRIVLSAALSARGAQVRLEDSGPGITEAQAVQAVSGTFDFAALEDASRSAGIGLAYVHRALAVQNSQLHFESSAAGTAAVFELLAA